MLFVRFVSVGLVGWLNRSSISMVALTVSFVIIASSCSDSEQSSNHNKRSASEVNTSSANIAVDNQRYALNQDNLNTEIKVKLKEYSDKLQSEGQVVSLSVYFKDLLNDQDFAINGNVQYSPASLMKVPVMLAMLKHVENDTSILNIRVRFRERRENNFIEQGDLQYNTQTGLVPGRAYTVDELLELMIINSDNEATILLLEYLSQNDPSRLNETQMELGLFVPNYAVNAQDFITVETYANFFKVIYDHSFLNDRMSEKAIGLLMRSTYTDGIRKGIPSHVGVAQKYGYKQINESQNQFHQFGIVLHQDHPYLIGIMTKGTNKDNFATLNRVAAELARITYDEVDNRAKLEKMKA